MSLNYPSHPFPQIGMPSPNLNQILHQFNQRTNGGLGLNGLEDFLAGQYQINALYQEQPQRYRQAGMYEHSLSNREAMYQSSLPDQEYKHPQLSYKQAAMRPSPTPSHEGLHQQSMYKRGAMYQQPLRQQQRSQSHQYQQQLHGHSHIKQQKQYNQMPAYHTQQSNQESLYQSLYGAEPQIHQYSRLPMSQTLRCSQALAHKAQGKITQSYGQSKSIQTHGQTNKTSVSTQTKVMQANPQLKIAQSFDQPKVMQAPAHTEVSTRSTAMEALAPPNNSSRQPSSTNARTPANPRSLPLSPVQAIKQKYIRSLPKNRPMPFNIDIFPDEISDMGLCYVHWGSHNVASPDGTETKVACEINTRKYYDIGQPAIWKGDVIPVITPTAKNEAALNDEIEAAAMAAQTDLAPSQTGTITEPAEAASLAADNTASSAFASGLQKRGRKRKNAETDDTETLQPASTKRLVARVAEAATEQQPAFRQHKPLLTFTAMAAFEVEKERGQNTLEVIEVEVTAKEKGGEIPTWNDVRNALRAEADRELELLAMRKSYDV